MAMSQLGLLIFVVDHNFVAVAVFNLNSTTEAGDLLMLRGARR